MKLSLSSLTLTVCCFKIRIAFSQGTTPEGHLEYEDDSRQNYLEDLVKSLTLFPTDANVTFLLTPLSPPDVVQSHLQYDLDEGDHQTEYHPNIDHLHI